MSDIDRHGCSARLSRVVVHDGVVYLAGVTADDCPDDVRDQTRQVLAKIDQHLASAGSNRARLLSAQIWLRDIARDYSAMNEIWDAWLDAGPAPARATVQSELADHEILVEIMVTAAATPTRRPKNGRPSTSP